MKKSPTPIETSALLLSAAAALALVYWLNFNFILNLIFAEGAYGGDMGLVGGLLYKPALVLETPSAFQTPGRSPIYYSTHFTPIHFLLGWPTHFVNVNTVYLTAAYLAGVIALAASSASFLVWRMVRSSLLQVSPWYAAVAIFLSTLLLAFSGLLLHAVAFPHFEFLFLPFGALFFYFSFSGRYAAASIPFALAIMVRGDNALHLAGFIFVWMIYLRFWLRRSLVELNPWLTYMVVALLIGMALIAAQRKFFPGDDALVRVYLGNPIFGHITLPGIGMRVVNMVSARVDLLVCAASALLLSILARDPRYVLGYVACIPWLVLNLLGINEGPYLLTLHYGFPFGLAVIWPIITLFASSAGSPRRPTLLPGRLGERHMPAVVLVVTLLGLIGSTAAFAARWDLHATVTRMRPPPADMVADGFAFQRMILHDLLERAHIGVDYAVAALSPHSMRREQVVDPRKELAPFGAVAFFATSIFAEQTIGDLIRYGYMRSFRIGASPIYVVFAPTEEGGRALAALRAAAVDVPLIEQNYLLARIRQGPAARKDRGFIATQSGRDGLVAFGPYIKPPAGPLRVEYSLAKADCRQPTAGQRFELAVTLNAQRIQLARGSFSADEVFGAAKCDAVLSLDFNVAPDQTGLLLEAPLWQSGGGAYLINGVRIFRATR